MLIIDRKVEEKLTIYIQGTPLYVQVLKSTPSHVKLGVTAPAEWDIRRNELDAVSLGHKNRADKIEDA